MGLDQYLSAKGYYSPAEWRGEQSNDTYRKIVESVDGDAMTKLSDYPSAKVSISVGYWRKCNQIHQWFVDNCQGGEDDCREAYVSREQLEELLRLCESVLMDKEIMDSDETARDLLPTASGFFFGSQEYDEWYYKDLEYTRDLLKNALATVPSDWDFTYQSSW